MEPIQKINVMVLFMGSGSKKENLVANANRK